MSLMSNDEYILRELTAANLSHLVQNAEDRVKLLRVVKSFALDALHDSAIRDDLFADFDFDDDGSNAP